MWVHAWFAENVKHVIVGDFVYDICIQLDITICIVDDCMYTCMPVLFNYFVNCYLVLDMLFS
jgi:hypothetical protein